LQVVNGPAHVEKEKEPSMEFDQIIDRSQYPSVKWNKASWQQHFGSDDLLPFWVADMEFEGPPVVVNTLVNRAEHGVFGYEYKSESYYDALVGWYRERHQWVIEPSYLEPSPSVLNIIAILINQHSAPGEGTIVQPPVFFEFRMVIRSYGRCPGGYS